MLSETRVLFSDWILMDSSEVTPEMLTVPVVWAREPELSIWREIELMEEECSLVALEDMWEVEELDETEPACWFTRDESTTDSTSSKKKLKRKKNAQNKI